MVQNRAALCLVRDLPQEQCGMLTRHYHSKTARDMGYAMIEHCQ